MNSRWDLTVLGIGWWASQSLAQSPPLCTVTAGTRSAVVSPTGEFHLRNIPAGNAPIRATTVCSRPDLTLYQYSEFFRVQNNVNYQVQNLLGGPTPPTNLVRVFTRRPGSTAPITSLNFTEQLSVGGDFSDGTTNTSLFRLTDGTQYISSNPAILSIDENGMIRSMGDGQAFITTINQGAASTALYQIFTGPPTTVSGLVWLESDNSPVSGATITLFGNQTISTTTGADGSFMLPGVLGQSGTTVTVRARATIGTESFGGSANNLAFVPGGITDAGIIHISLRPPAPGPIIVSGMDPEDHGFPSGAGGTMIVDIVRFCARNSFLHPTPTRVLMIGGSSGIGSATASILAGAGLTTTQVTGSAITTVDLNPATTPYDVIYMPTGAADVSGGLSPADVALLNARSADLVEFVNRGGGVAAFAQNIAGGFGWFPLGGLQTNSGGLANSIALTPDGQLVLSASATQVIPFHQAFTGPPGFFGLKVLAVEGSGQGRALIVGGIAELP